MPAVTVIRTHERGLKCKLRNAQEIPGPVELESVYVAELNRHVPRLRVPRGRFSDGRPRPDAIPPLYEPRLLTFCTEFGLMVTGFEQIEGCRFYQGWYIRWVAI